MDEAGSHEEIVCWVVCAYFLFDRSLINLLLVAMLVSGCHGC